MTSVASAAFLGAAGLAAAAVAGRAPGFAIGGLALACGSTKRREVPTEAAVAGRDDSASAWEVKDLNGCDEHHSEYSRQSLVIPLWQGHCARLPAVPGPRRVQL